MVLSFAGNALRDGKSSKCRHSPAWALRVSGCGEMCWAELSLCTGPISAGVLSRTCDPRLEQDLEQSWGEVVQAGPARPSHLDQGSKPGMRQEMGVWWTAMLGCPAQHTGHPHWDLPGLCTPGARCRRGRWVVLAAVVGLWSSCHPNPVGDQRPGDALGQLPAPAGVPCCCPH